MNRPVSVLWRGHQAHAVSAVVRLGADKSRTTRSLVTDEPRAPCKGTDQGATHADLNPDEWDLPPKPKWMRWRTYNRHVERFDEQEKILDFGMFELVAKPMGTAGCNWIGLGVV